MTSEHPQLQAQFKVLLEKYLKNRPDAFRWVLDFWTLGHQIDDVIDIPERRADNAFLGLVWNKYIDVLSASFYRQYADRLYPIVKAVHHIYFDSLEWEKDETEWKATFADVYRCSGSALIIAVIEIIVYEETGSYDASYEAAREVSIAAKECAYAAHHTDKGEKV